MVVHTGIPRILIALTNAYATHRDMLRGILDYERSHAKWSIDLRTGRRGETKVRPTDLNACNAIIVNRTTPSLIRTIRARRIPAVLVSPCCNPRFPGAVLRCDNEPIAVAAAQHLRHAGCASFAFASAPETLWSTLRGRSFADAIRKDGGGKLLRWPAGKPLLIKRLLENAPKPLGIFAADDVRAREVLDLCRDLRIHVPDEVAIVGVDNDETLCEMSVPTLSSIPLHTRDAGYRAAETLDRAMRGELKFGKLPEIIYSGDTIIQRQSTSRALGKDALVRHCHNQIVTRYREPLRIDALARELGVSRRTLETHFRTLTGRSIAADILAVRLEKAKSLLSETNRTQDDIATNCGFCDASHLCSVFRRELGYSPATFRKSSMRK